MYMFNLSSNIFSDKKCYSYLYDNSHKNILISKSIRVSVISVRTAIASSFIFIRDITVW